MAVTRNYQSPAWSAGGGGPSSFFWACSTEAELPTSGVGAGDKAYTADTARWWQAPSANVWLTRPGAIKTLASAVVTSGTGETAILSCRIPANVVAVGSTFRCRLVGVSSSTGTLIFRARVGANGTTADAQAWISTTSAAQAANARAGLDVLVAIRSIGGSGTAYADGAAHAGAVLLPTLIGAAATAAVATNAAWFVTLTATCSVGTFTAQVGSVEAL